MSDERVEQAVRVGLGERGYDVVVGDGILGGIGGAAREVGLRGRCALISDERVAGLYGDEVEGSLRAAGYEVVRVEVPEGEASKSLGQVEACCGAMARGGLDRGSFVLALGGGVVGDLAGLVAAVYYRGVPYVQVPTTVVAQVDSSVGGKTGVNLGEGKNLVGAFHQPRLVWADVATLATLGEREYREGFAEVIKHAAIRDAAMLDGLGARVAERGGAGMVELMARNVAIKARVVEEDERETAGVRALLNFGHTAGHGIEAAGGYGRFLHGEAISLGLVVAVRLSVQVAGLAEGEAARVLGALEEFGLPMVLPEDVEIAAVLEAMGRDKKFEGGQVRFVLLRALGDAFVSEDVTVEMVGEVLSP
jgi:3-dehydroquinate synthase